MTYDEYQKEALKFLNPALTQKDIELDTVLGISGEFTETVQAILTNPIVPDNTAYRAACINELGDVLWYITVGLNEQGYSLSKAMNIARDTARAKREDSMLFWDVIFEFVQFYGYLADEVKKRWFQYHNIRSEYLIAAYSNILGVWLMLMNVCSPTITVQQVMETNIKKLGTRYPNGFTREASIARVDEAKGK